MPDITQEVDVINSLGIHARPAAMLVQRMLAFESEIYISYNTHRINAKSIMGLLTLAVGRGSRLMVSCSGPDAEEAMAAAQEIFASGFGEE